MFIDGIMEPGPLWKSETGLYPFFLVARVCLYSKFWKLITTPHTSYIINIIGPFHFLFLTYVFLMDPNIQTFLFCFQSFFNHQEILSLAGSMSRRNIKGQKIWIILFFTMMQCNFTAINLLFISYQFTFFRPNKFFLLYFQQNQNLTTNIILGNPNIRIL